MILRNPLIIQLTTIAAAEVAHATETAHQAGATEEMQDSTGEKQAQQTLLQKYAQWKAAVEDSQNALKVFSFFFDNQHWPLFDKCVKTAEQNIETAPKAIIAKWFKKYRPKTSQGLLAYCRHLLETDPEMAKKYISQTWVFQNMSEQCAREFRQKFGDILSPADDARKAKWLTKQNKIIQLKALTDVVIPEIANYIKMFLGRLLRLKITKHSYDELKNAQRRLGIVRALVKKNKMLEAAEILALTNNGEEDQEIEFYNIRRRIAYDILRANKPALAYKIMKMSKLHRRKNGEDFAKKEWLLGYISFRFLRDFAGAIRHFEAVYDSARNAIRRSKGAFWLAEVYVAQNDIVLAIGWYQRAAEFFNTFYGHMAACRLFDIRGQDHIGGLYGARQVPAERRITFNARELVQVLATLPSDVKKEDKKYIEHIYRQLISDIEDPDEELLLLDIATSDDELDLLISTEATRQHYFANRKAYKFLCERELVHVRKINPDPFFTSLVHAVIQQESRFNPLAQSHAGAIGLMQIMPATASHELKRARFYGGSSRVSLYDRQKNISIGSLILNRLLRKYNGSLTSAIAAYNCGEGNFARFKNSIHSILPLPAIDTIELIPYKETRVYVKCVIRNLFVYMRLLNVPCHNSCKVLLG